MPKSTSFLEIGRKLTEDDEPGDEDNLEE